MRRLHEWKRIRLCLYRSSPLGVGYIEAAWEHREPSTLSDTCEVTFEGGLSATQRAYALDKDNLFCKMCGVVPGDIDDLTGRSVKFHIERITGNNAAEVSDSLNLRALCSSCYEGAKDIISVKPPAIRLLSQVRRAGQEEQRAVLNWLLKKFKV
jgi:hypothetical protein